MDKTLKSNIHVCFEKNPITIKDEYEQYSNHNATAFNEHLCLTNSFGQYGHSDGSTCHYQNTIHLYLTYGHWNTGTADRYQPVLFAETRSVCNIREKTLSHYNIQNTTVDLVYHVQRVNRFSYFTMICTVWFESRAQNTHFLGMITWPKEQ